MNEDIIQAIKDRRFREISVSTLILADVFRGGCFFKSDLPENIHVEGVYSEYQSNSLIVRLASPRFECVTEGCYPPRDNGVELFYLEHIHNEKD